MVIDETWDQKIDYFYEHEFEESDPNGSIGRMRALASERQEGDAAALFELGGVHDALGFEDEAIPLYRQAIEAGLEGERATRVFIQLASTLRNVGASAEAVSMLESMPASSDDEAPRQAFLALALYDEGRYGDVLRTVLNALIPTLDGYRRALTEYAEDLLRTVPRGRRSVAVRVPFTGHRLHHGSSSLVTKCGGVQVQRLTAIDEGERCSGWRTFTGQFLGRV